MKKALSRIPSSRPSGFTLVELLVVIAIIGILAGVLLSAGGMAIRMAQRTKAANMANQLQTACMGYYTEYSLYPVPTGTTTDYLIGDALANAPAWKILLCALSGNISPLNGSSVPATTIANTRGIAFLSLKLSDVYDSANPTFVAPINPLPTGTSKYFNIAMDSDYDGILGVAPSAVTTLPNFATSTLGTINTGGASTAGIAVWANCNGTAPKANPNYYVHTY